MYALQQAIWTPRISAFAGWGPVAAATAVHRLFTDPFLPVVNGRNRVPEYQTS